MPVLYQTSRYLITPINFGWVTYGSQEAQESIELQGS